VRNIHTLVRVTLAFQMRTHLTEELGVWIQRRAHPGTDRRGRIAPVVRKQLLKLVSCPAPGRTGAGTGPELPIPLSRAALSATWPTRRRSR